MIKRYSDCVLLLITYIFNMPETIVSSDEISCTFKDDFCGWTIRNSSGVGWKRYQYNSPLSSSGPQGAYGNDSFYIYFDTTNVIRGSQTMLVSPVLNKLSRGCIRFYYHMYGNTMGSLSFGIELVDNTESVKWTISGDQGQLWHCEVLQVRSEVNDKVFFKATRGDDIYSIIALDNITLFLNAETCRECSDFAPQHISPTVSTFVNVKSSSKQPVIESGTTQKVPQDTISNTVLYVIYGVVGVAVIGIFVLVVSLCRHRRKMLHDQHKRERDKHMENARQNQPRPSVTPSEKYTNLPNGSSDYEGLKREEVYDFIDERGMAYTASETTRTDTYDGANYVDPLNVKGPVIDPERRTSLQSLPPLPIPTVSSSPSINDGYSDYLNPI